MVATLAFGAILSWLRPATGSVWPVVIAHTVWNALINAGFTFATQNASKNMWIGETGILVAVTLVIAAMLLRRSWSPRQLVNDMGNTLVEAQEQVGRGIGRACTWIGIRLLSGFDHNELNKAVFVMIDFIPIHSKTNHFAFPAAK